MSEKILPARRQTLILGSGGATVTGPALGVNNEVAVFSGTTGRAIKVADGPITLTAGGSNQNITLTPSGTGKTLFGPASLSSTVSVGAVSDAVGYGLLSFNGVFTNGGSCGVIGGGGGSQLFVTSPAGGSVEIRSGTTTQFLVNNSRTDINPGGVQSARFVGTHLLLGGLTTDGTGVLQFPAATTSAGGIAFGTDVFLYRNAAQSLRLDSGAGSVDLASSLIGNANSDRAVMSTGATNSTTPAFARRDDTNTGLGLGGSDTLYLITNGTAALTLDSSQNATFSGVIVHKAYTVATLPTASSYTYGIAFVSDATNAAGANIGTAPTGGGAVKRAVYSDGTNWLLL